MSEHVTYEGKLREVYAEFNSLEDKLIQLFQDKDIELDDFEKNNIISYFYDYDLYDDYTILGNKVYEIIQKKKLKEDVFKMTVNKDGELEYLVSYYNGGCGFSEALEYAHKKLNT